MCMYNYIVLVKLERDHPSVMEGYVMAYIFLHGLEMIREVGIFFAATHWFKLNKE